MTSPVNDNSDEITDYLLANVELDRTFFVRFRRAWLEGDELHVRARLGGESNRQHYAQVFALLRGHPFYLDDRDDPTDGAYCIFRFASTARAASIRGKR